jgi:NADH dehydrogenase
MASKSQGAGARKRVVIVGMGFGGLSAARELGGRKDIDVVALDRRNYHLFQPLLYQVAMAGLSPGEIAAPIRGILSRYKNIQCLMTNVEAVDDSERVARADMGPISYDWLILACGAQHSYFGHEDWEPFAPGLKTVEQATEVRRRVLTAFELAERELDPEREKWLMTFVVVGGGPTGVELAGAIGEISRFALSRDFRHIDPRRTRVVLVEAGPRILSSFDPALAQRAVLDLERLGVTCMTGARVTEVDAQGVRLGAERLDAATVLWAAGVLPSPLSRSLDTPLDSLGRAQVAADLSLPWRPEIFVIGDQARAAGPDGAPFPGLAPVAMQQGRCAARNIVADLEGRPREPFKYRDKGQMATIGRRRAIVQVGRLKFGGWLAWYTWLVVHIFYLIGFKNRLLVLIQWAWSYFSYKRGAQLITQKEWRSFRPDPGQRAKSLAPK